MRTNMARPIKPSEVPDAKVSRIPDGVFEAFNELIVENWSNDRARVNQKDAVERIADKVQCLRQDVFDKGWLDVEDIYRKAGWLVEYDKPGYNESYEAFFIFKKK